MTTPTNNERLQLLLMDYLYGEMTERERQAFARELQSSPELQALLRDAERLDGTLPIGTQPRIDAERLQGNRWMLQQTLQREQRTAFSLQSWLQALAQRPLTVAFQGVAMAATFVLGMLIATEDPRGGDAALLAGTEPSAELSPLQLIESDDYEIYQLKVNSYDAASGAIDLSFSLASESRVQGNVADREIHKLMAVALQDDIDSASRMDTINALQPVSSGTDVQDALIYVLRNDENPGVRYQAVQSLVALASVDRVRDALRYALSEDINPGVRLEAFQALTKYQDPETLAVFRQQMESDSNEYIRTQARNIVEGTADAASIEL